MSSLGVFRNVDETLAMSSGGDDPSFEPLYSCPSSRIKFLEDILKMDGVQPYSCSPHFPRSDYQGAHFCKLPVVPFSLGIEKSDYHKFKCGACLKTMLSTGYYACHECGGKFHKECVESLLEIKHPSHPFHSFRLYSYIMTTKSCLSCKESIYNMGYHCSICNLNMHPVCARRIVHLVVDHPKSHLHPLTLFPAQASLVCNVCATIKKFDPTYICIQCVFVIHENCIGFPHVIRISRHKHRIIFILSLPSGKFSCGVCREQVDNNYGAYSCKNCDAYFVHSNCALHEDVWDGKELEDVPEEDDIIDDGEPFERIADGIILHPFHSHQLRLEVIKAYNINKYCQGCALPTSEDHFYSCKDCEFIIHESCASAPRMKRHPLYPHPLILRVAGHDNGDGSFNCNQCHREGNGFFYEHGRKRFQLDLRCASIIEPFKYEGHEHLLFLPWHPGKKTRCRMCKNEESHNSMLICLTCDYTICHSCVALPYKVRYKHDSHLLTICDGKEASDEPDWCENCECKIEEVKIKETRYHGEIYRRVERRYYKCNDCCTTLHVYCLLGIDMFVRPDNTEKDMLSFSEYSSRVILEVPKEWINVWIRLNNSLSRPICTGCECRCRFPIVFKGKNTVFCSLNCVGIWIRALGNACGNDYAKVRWLKDVLKLEENMTDEDLRCRGLIKQSVFLRSLNKKIPPFYMYFGKPSRMVRRALN